MKLTQTGSRWIVESRFEERHLPKGAGFRWDPARKAWWTDDAAKAERLASLIAGGDDAVTAEVARIEREKAEAIAASRATDAAIEIPAPEGLAYLPYQRAGIAFGGSRPSVLIGDDMGLGKTIQAIGIVNADPTVKRVLIVCPASLKLNWKRETEKWLVRPMAIAIANGVFPSDADVVIVNYDILAKHADAIREREWDVLIVDEAHYLKNPKAIRTRQVFGDDKDLAPIPARRRVILTGTPIPNRPIELWPILHGLDPQNFRSVFTFAKRYCAAKQISIGRGRYAWDFSGASNLPELQERLRSTLMIRRLKGDVLTELPPKRRQVVELPPTDEIAEAIADELSRYEAVQDEIEEAEDAAAIAKETGDEVAYEAAVARLRAARQIAFEAIAAFRREIAVAKVPAVVEFLRDAMEDGRKVVCFAHHHEVIDGIVAAFPDLAVKLDGRDSMEDRQASVDRFQSDPSVRLFVGGIMAAGVGLTLTASAHVVFAELDWVPGNVTQAEDRCHRIGQTDSVLVQHLVIDGSLDSKMAKTLVRKQDVIDRALDRIAVESDEAKKRREAREKRAQEPKETAEMPAARIASILDALRLVASACDGARTEDGAGFGKFDTAFGSSLAARTHLTIKQAEAGLRLVTKYRRQIPSDLLAACGVEAKPKADRKRKKAA